VTADRPLRVAVVGVGTMGLDHVRRLSTVVRGVTVSAIVEPGKQQVESALALVRDAEPFETLDGMLAADVADAVVVASPGRFHEDALHAVLDAGLPTLCEKPLTMTAESARRVVDHEMTLSSPLLQVGFQRRYDAGYVSLRELIRSGEVGQLLALHCRHRNRDLPPGWDDAMLVEDAAAHEMDIVAWLAGEPVVSVEVHRAKRNSLAREGIHDPLLLLLRTSSGVLADVEINMNYRAGYQVSTEAVLETGSAEIGRAHGLVLTQDARVGTAEHLDYVTRFAAAYDLEVQSWADAVSAGRRTGATAWDGYRAVLLCEAGLQAQVTGERVTVPDEPTPAFYATE
jgi:myo-inositol 2-dehydrogenase / D-chiro-inositol 1-dehydrogenase